MKVPFHIDDPNMRKLIDEIVAKLNDLNNSKPDGRVIVGGTTTKHKFELKVEDRDIANPTWHFTDLGE